MNCIEGILRDFVKCTREQTLMGNTVKVDDLAIFKVSVIGNGCAKLYDKDSDKTISASLGSLYNPKTHQTDYRVDCDGDSDGDGNDLMLGVLNEETEATTDFRFSILIFGE